MDPINCKNDKCSNHDLESYHCCSLAHCNGAVTKCDDYIHGENDIMMEKPEKPETVNLRYRLKTGKFGCYHYDCHEDKDLTLDDVTSLLNNIATAEIDPPELELETRENCGNCGLNSCHNETRDPCPVKDRCGPVGVFTLWIPVVSKGR